MRIFPQLGHGVDLGSGFKSLTLEGRPVAVEVDDKSMSESDVSSAQQVHYRFAEITSISTLANFLDMSMSASFDFVVASGAARAEFVTQREINSYDYYVALRCTVRNKERRLLKPSFHDQAKQILDSGNIQHFYNTFGDCYAHSAVSGGELIAVIHCSTNSQRERDNMSVNASVGGLFADASVDVNKALTNDFFRKLTDITIYRAGAVTKLPSIAELREYSLRFVEEVAANKSAWLMELDLWPYNTVITSPPPYEFADNLKPLFFLDNLARLNSSAKKLRSEYQYALRNPKQFSSFDKVAVSTASAGCDKVTDAIKTKALEVIKDPFDENRLQDDQIPDMPQLLLERRIQSELPIELYISSGAKQDSFGSWEIAEFPSGIRPPIDGFSISLVDKTIDLRIEYKAWLADKSETPWMFSPFIIRGKLIGFSVRLTGALAEFYSVEYCADVSAGTWWPGLFTGILRNGAYCGFANTTGAWGTPEINSMSVRIRARDSGSTIAADANLLAKRLLNSKRYQEMNTRISPLKKPAE